MTDIHIEGHNVSVTEAIDSYARTKIEKLRPFFDDITTVNVLLKLDSNNHIAEITMHVPHNKSNMHAEASSHDLYKSIDAVEKKVEDMLRRRHDKMKEH